MAQILPLAAKTHTVAIVDANPVHRTAVVAALLSFYRVVEYAEGYQALAAFRRWRPDLLLVGERTSPLSGAELVGLVREEERFEPMPIIVIADDAEVGKLETIHRCGATTHLVKPYWRSTLIKTISSLLNAGVEREWESLPPLQREALKGTINVFNDISDVIDQGQPIAYATVSGACRSLVEAVNRNDFKTILHGVRDHDNYSYVHSLRVATLLCTFGHTIGLPKSDELLLASGGLLHDVGKMSIPHEVLNKPGQLTDAEWQVMKSHVSHSVNYLRRQHDIPHAIITIAEQHHEKLDGSGYPNGLAGGQLNELARMASIVDVFSALTDRRVYKPPIAIESVLAIMTHEMAHHLDGHLLHMFGEMLLDTVADDPPGDQI